MLKATEAPDAAALLLPSALGAIGDPCCSMPLLVSSSTSGVEGEGSAQGSFSTSTSWALFGAIALILGSLMMPPSSVELSPLALRHRDQRASPLRAHA